MRDDFSQGNKEIIAGRVNYLCSNPACRQQTRGPQEDPRKAVNIGVAAHITAASPGGARYDPSLTPEERCSPENGIWLCQNHGKLVDNDEVRFTVAMLRAWKKQAEDSVREAIERPRPQPAEQRAFQKAERHMPDLLREMRNDLKEHPLFREFVVLKKTWTYNHEGLYFAFHYEDHPDLDEKLRVLENLGLMDDITATNVKRFNITEAFVDYLEATQSPDEFIEAIGVWFDRDTGLHYCPRCRSENKRSPLKNDARGFSCMVCSQYFNDPSRPRHDHPAADLGPHGWMAN